MTRKFSGRELVVATHNNGKLDEFRALFADKKIKLFSAADFNLPSPDETGTTFLENAKLKALYVARETKKPALADDSGLCVAALNGAPGVYSADWAGAPRDFSAAMKKIHDALGESKNKKAAFVSCLVLAWPDGASESVEGRVTGMITWPPRGDKGHGYDPIFIPDGFDKTYGEMDEKQKNSISHRAVSFKMMMKKCFT